MFGIHEINSFNSLHEKLYGWLSLFNDNNNWYKKYSEKIKNDKNNAGYVKIVHIPNKLVVALSR